MIAAILSDERKTASALLRKDPSLVACSISKARFESKIVHWLYAGDTPLHAAASAYRVEIAKLLLQSGADASATGNHRRSQPLHYAADGHPDSEAWNPKRQVAMIGLLLESGADIHAPDKNGATPLHRAVRTRCAEAVECLLEAGADPTLRNKPGSTPFHLAVQNTGRGGTGAESMKCAQRQIIQAFLDKGVSPETKDQNGKSVLQWSRSDWIREMLAGFGE